jgi:hypothetical protein
MAFRVSPPNIFPAATRAARPPIGAAGSADAHRQVGFVLSADIDLVLRGLELEGRRAEASSGAKFRTQPVASGLAYWSRGWLSRLQALHALEWGNYTAALPLIRAAADYLAAEIALTRTAAAEWEEWLADGGVRLAPEHHATEYRLHAFRSAEVLAGHETLAPLYRAVTDLALPHFGATLLTAAGESTPDRILATFGDRDFHFALAELELGWLLQLSIAQLEALDEPTSPFAPDPSGDTAAFIAEARALLSNPNRCHVEQIEANGEQRYLVHNLRRTPSGAPKRVLL